jgi:membrane protease YdiL (CAAX protease family)
MQVFLFVFISASVAEEMLFRGFLMNFLKPLETQGVSIFKIKLSVPVIVSAIAFGMAHLVLLSTEVSVLFVIRIVIFTTCLGLIAGYYHEKYNNHAYAILVHMSGNLLAVLGAFVMHG